MILDDTFKDRQAFSDVAYLDDAHFSNYCRVYSVIKITEINRNIIQKLDSCKLVCYHKSLQLYDASGDPIIYHENARSRESLLNKIAENKILAVKFSLGENSDLNTLTIDKKLFYDNLKVFIEHFIQLGLLEYKILYYGSNYGKVEFNILCNDVFLEIKNSIDLKALYVNKRFQEKIELIFKNDPAVLIEKWTNAEVNKYDLIRLINKANSKSKNG